MRKTYQITDGRVVQGSEGENLILVFINPDEEEKKFLLEELNIDEHTLGSALDPDELSRLEFEPEHLAVIFKRPKNVFAKDQFLFKVGSVGMFLFPTRLVVIMSEDSSLFDGKEFNRVRSLPDIFLRLILRSIIHFREHLKVISMISDELQNKINTSMENSHLLNMFSLEKSLEYYLNSLNSNGLLLDRLKNYSHRIGFLDDDIELLDDTLVENTQCSKQAEIYSNILAGLMDARASIVNNNLNVLMKKLNFITICIMAPNLVVSIFSMNVAIPFERHPHAFGIILGIAVASVFGFAMIWRMKKW